MHNSTTNWNKKSQSEAPPKWEAVIVFGVFFPSLIAHHCFCHHFASKNCWLFCWLSQMYLQKFYYKKVKIRFKLINCNNIRLTVRFYHVNCK